VQSISTVLIGIGTTPLRRAGSAVIGIRVPALRAG
jgi:hypothetical protein